MKRIKAVNGYTIYQATARDVAKYNVDEGYFYLYFSSDIRDYGLSMCDWDMEAGSIEEAEAFANGTNYAIAKEIVEETTTAASFEEIQAVEAKLDSGMSREEIEEESEDEGSFFYYNTRDRRDEPDLFYDDRTIRQFRVYPATPKIVKASQEDNSPLWPVHDPCRPSWEPVKCKNIDEAYAYLLDSMNLSIYEYIHNI